MSTTNERPRASCVARIMQVLLFGGGLVVILVLAGLGVLLAYEQRYQDRVYPGTHVLGVDLSGMTRDEARAAIAAAFTYPAEANMTLRYGERVWTVTPAELGVGLDLDTTVDQAMQVGRLGASSDRLNDQGYALWYRVDLSPVVVYDQARALAVLNSIGAEIDHPPQEALLSVNGTQVNYTPGAPGMMLDVPGALALLDAPVAEQRAATIDLPVGPVQPHLADASAAAQAARNILAAPIVLYNAAPLTGDPESTWTLTLDRLAQMLILRRVEDEQGPRYLVALDANQLRPFLEPIAPLFHRETADARYTFNDTTHELDVIAPATPGRELDVDDTLAAIQTAAATADHRVALVFTVTQPKYNDQVKAADLGIKELLTEQVTYFAGSPPDRVTNITVAAARFQGIVIAPGEEFSFLKYLGDVSLENGFAEALIIYDGRTIKGLGGGVCQVSTTAFRASFTAGLPTIERWPHAYRVGWYERGFGPGLDATVFEPEVDFKFLNDTPGHILMEMYVYPASGTLLVKLYGTKDRDVAISAPEIVNVVPHPPDKYEENPELAAGEIKQTEHAIDGADVTVWRTVSRNGVELFRDKVFTRYVPWAAVYQYGPGTPDMPPPGYEPTPTPTP
jgi:vancomycin resistance protein YoaR